MTNERVNMAYNRIYSIVIELELSVCAAISEIVPALLDHKVIYKATINPK